MTASHFGTIRREILRHHLRQGLVWQTDVVEFAIDVERGHVFLDVEGVRHVSGVENEVKFEGPGFRPVFFAGDDEFFGAHGESVVLFAGAVGKSVDFSAEGFGPEDAEVAEAAAGRICEPPFCIKGEKWRNYTPKIATFFPGPVFARTRGLQTVMPAHIMGPASVEEMLSGILKVKYSWALIWLEYPP